MAGGKMGSLGQILVVDDESRIRQVCERTLMQMGFDVQSAPDGQAAMKCLSAQYFDFVLTDLAMPESINGERLTEEIKHKWPSTDVVIMTAYPALETAIPTLKHGAYDYLIKPFSLELLRSVVSRCFERRNLAKELNRERLLRHELEAAYAELQKVERLKEAIMSRVSHELRTPLCSGFMALEALEPLSQNSANSKSCGIIRSSLTKLREIVENLLLFASHAHTNVSLERSDVNLHNLIEVIIRRYKPLWDQRQISVEVIWGEKIKSLWADSKQLHVAFKHLFLNAIYFNKRGGHILIQGSEQPDDISISFSDTGIGIEREKLSQVFDGFYQAAECLSREVGGLGLGLAIVRRIAEAHGGSVWVESEAGRGSKFTLKLPNL